MFIESAEKEINEGILHSNRPRCTSVKKVKIEELKVPQDKFVDHSTKLIKFEKMDYSDALDTNERESGDSSESTNNPNVFLKCETASRSKLL